MLVAPSKNNLRCYHTSLSGLGAHSSDNKGDLDIIVAHVWMSGWLVQTLKNNKVFENAHETDWTNI